MHDCLTTYCSWCSVVLSYNYMTLRSPVRLNPRHQSLFFCIFFSETKLLQCWNPHINTKMHHWKRIWIWTRQIWLTALCNGCPCLRVIGFVLQVLRRSDLFVQLWASLLHVLQCWLLDSNNTEVFTTYVILYIYVTAQLAAPVPNEKTEFLEKAKNTMKWDTWVSV